MAYVKNTTWANGGAPGISAAALNNLETQYDEAVSYIGTLPLARINSGSFTGNASDHRAIPHALGVTPKFVYIVDTTGGHQYTQVAGWDYTITVVDRTFNPETAMNSTNFYASNATTNLNGRVYYWVAMG